MSTLTRILSPEATALLDAAVAHIDAHPEQWNQAQWWCGTTGCIAGWVCELAGSKRHDGVEADRLLGITWSHGMWDGENSRAVIAVWHALLVGRVVSTDTAQAAFGPQGTHVVALIQQCQVMTEAQIKQVAAAWAARAPWAALDAARSAARSAALDAALDAARSAALDAAGAAAGDAAVRPARAAWAAAGAAARDAARTLVVRDLIDPGGFTQAKYDILTMPLRNAGITIHPDDAEIR